MLSAKNFMCSHYQGNLPINLERIHHTEGASIVLSFNSSILVLVDPKFYFGLKKKRIILAMVINNVLLPKQQSALLHEF